MGALAPELGPHASSPAEPLSPATAADRPTNEELNLFYQKFWSLPEPERAAFVAEWQKRRAERAKPKLDGRSWATLENRGAIR